MLDKKIVKMSDIYTRDTFKHPNRDSSPDMPRNW